MPPQAAPARSPQAFFAAAQALARQRKPRQAEQILDRLVERFPRHFGTLRLLGIIALQTGRSPRAIEFLRRAVAVNPKAAGVYNALGEALRNVRKPQEALECYNKAIILNPDVAEGYNNKAIALHELKRYEHALWNYDKAIALKPDMARAYFNRGNTLRVMKRLEDALASYDKALEIAPAFEKPYVNRGTILNDLDRCEEALENYDRAVAIKPNYAQALYNRGNTLRDLKRPEEAIASYDKALELRPGYPQASWNKGNCLFQLGRYEEALPLYEYRASRALVVKKRGYTEPVWRGEDIAGKTLFIYPELYLGDMIQYCRFAKAAEARGAKVIIAVQKSLRRLLSSLGPSVTLIAEDEKPEAFDFHCPLMSLPLAFKTTLETIPAEVPYLHAEEDRIAQWKEKLGDNGIKIGVCWQGSKTTYAEKLKRSFSPALFRNIAALPNVRLISLQKPGKGKDAIVIPDDMPIETLGDDLDAGPDAFLDTAAVMQSLDLVITTDTAVAHLAGALGRPVWLVLKHVPDWRWLLDRDDSPWYPTMRLFRQKTRSDWQSAFDDVENALIAEFHLGG